MNRLFQHHIRTPAERAELRRIVMGAPLLTPPLRTAPTGALLLDVQSIGTLEETGEAYIRLTDHSVYRLPELFLPWTEALLHTIQANPPQPGEQALLPARIAFAILNGQAMAERHDLTPTLQGGAR